MSGSAGFPPAVIDRIRVLGAALDRALPGGGTVQDAIFAAGATSVGVGFTSPLKESSEYRPDEVSIEIGVISATAKTAVQAVTARFIPGLPIDIHGDPGCDRAL